MKELINDLRMYADDIFSVAGVCAPATALSLAADAIERMENEVVAATLQIENDSKIIESLTRERMGLALDAARYLWLAEYLPSMDESYDDAIVACNDAAEIDAVIDAAMQGGVA